MNKKIMELVNRCPTLEWNDAQKLLQKCNFDINKAEQMNIELNQITLTLINPGNLQMRTTMST